MPKQRITADDLVRKMAESLKGGQTVKSRTQTAAAGDAGTQGGQSFKNPMTAAGDLIVGGESGAAVRLGAGTDGQVLTLVAAAAAWTDATGGGGGTGSDYLYWTADSAATEPIWLMTDGKLLRR